MQRKIDPELKKLYDDNKKVYSISRLNTLNQCEYQAYLKYIEGLKGENVGIYGILGGKTHDTIEACIKGEANSDDLKQIIQQELSDLEMFGIEFPVDKNGNSAIKDNWIANMTRFSEEFTTPKGIFDTEKLLIYPIDEDHYMIGYADAIRHNSKNKNKVWLIDWKTSSQFTGEHLIEAGRQLVIYKLALEKLGLEVEKCSWCMVKYCITTYEQYVKKSKEYVKKEKISEWRNLIKDLKNVIEKFLKEEGYDDVDIECYIHDCLKVNSFDPLPDVIKNKFNTKIYVRDYEITDDIIDETINYIKSSIDKFEEYGNEELNYKPCDCNKNSFFCNALCDYGGKSGQCKYWIDFCNTFEKKSNEDEDEDLF